MNGHGPVPIKLYLQEQVAGQTWPLGCSLLTPVLECGIFSKRIGSWSSFSRSVHIPQTTLFLWPALDPQPADTFPLLHVHPVCTHVLILFYEAHLWTGLNHRDFCSDFILSNPNCFGWKIIQGPRVRLFSIFRFFRT